MARSALFHVTRAGVPTDHTNGPRWRSAGPSGLTNLRNKPTIYFIRILAAMRESIAVVLLCAAFTLRSVHAHGYLASPKSRNLLASEAMGYSCPHCLNGGGVDEVSQGGALQWPRGLRTLSGDPASESSPRSFEAGGELYAGTIGGNYTQGSVVDFRVVLTTNHNGRFSFRICKVRGGYDEAVEMEAEQLNNQCLDQHVLLQANVKGAQMPGERYWYTLPEDAAKSVEYQMFYELPQGLVCDGIDSHCVLQWYWLTFNSCQTPDAPVRYTRAANNMPMCDAPTASYPEEFANLADIMILRTSAGLQSHPALAPMLVAAGLLFVLM